MLACCNVGHDRLRNSFICVCYQAHVSADTYVYETFYVTIICTLFFCMSTYSVSTLTYMLTYMMPHMLSYMLTYYKLNVITYPNTDFEKKTRKYRNHLEKKCSELTWYVFNICTLFLVRVNLLCSNSNI